MEKISKLIENIASKLEDAMFRRYLRYGIILILTVLLVVTFATDVNVKENKEYKDWDHVALYIIEYNDVPDNYVPKSQGVSDDDYDITVFDVYDNTRTPVLLPTGYTYTEVYINANKDNIQGDSKERFVFSDEQLFYTDDHYLSFEEIDRFDILGTHYIFLALFWTTTVSTTMLIVVSVRKGYLSVTIIKSDVLEDLKLVKTKANELFCSLREKIEGVD
jgi:hypothetical protein